MSRKQQGLLAVVILLNVLMQSIVYIQINCMHALATIRQILIKERYFTVRIKI